MLSLQGRQEKRQVSERLGTKLCRGSGGRFSLNDAELELGRGALLRPHAQWSGSQGNGKPLLADDALAPTHCYDQLPAFGGVLGAGFFFTVASPKTKKFTGYFLSVLCLPKLLNPRRMLSCPLVLHPGRALSPVCPSGDLAVSHRQPHDQMNIRSLRPSLREKQKVL